MSKDIHTQPPLEKSIRDDDSGNSNGQVVVEDLAPAEKLSKATRWGCNVESFKRRENGVLDHTLKPRHLQMM